MNRRKSLSLLIPYRNRPQQLQTQMAWLQGQDNAFWENIEVILVNAELYSSPWLERVLKGVSFYYFHYPLTGVFHKTKLLNLALNQATGEFVIPYDVDLIPLENTLEKHLEIAGKSLRLLISGYRLLSAERYLNPSGSNYLRKADISEQLTIAPEDQPTALYKHLWQQERFGVVPFFHRQRLLEIGGWDEQFVGWGGEDQDIIERYLADGRYLCRSPELVYIHLHHPKTDQWSESEVIRQNRQYYYNKRKP
ncbi:glycosyltransferase family 2 protein [Spirulina sp. CS-785/01]|uniref:glycosyltransferase family 2 protein n=1 Tax=Spirulina sp. CS-785/01 TaxID=3021716 RepID=UPI00232F5B95|nr:glycosyltransferase family 2 protein [Spirulina sp. CS-785/01]MDB9314562.1 glycosyltransferase family 2 protein [Spirulina sp. CS-785/01]